MVPERTAAALTTLWLQPPQGSEQWPSARFRLVFHAACIPNLETGCWGSPAIEAGFSGHA